MTDAGEPVPYPSAGQAATTDASRQAVDVLVVVPARDEADRIEACLTSVARALARAERLGVVGRVRVAVAAHRCSDATGARARQLLDEAGVPAVVLDDDESISVGEVRARLVERGMWAKPAPDPQTTWVLSTDADTVVPEDWVATLLDVAHRTGADLVAGYVDLDPTWDAPPAAREAYADLMRLGSDVDRHDHVWAANLAVRCSTYLQVGGFPSVLHGEERALAAEVARVGTVVGSFVPRVTTSARMPGRARHGLGDLLRRLADDRTNLRLQGPEVGTAVP